MSGSFSVHFYIFNCSHARLACSFNFEFVFHCFTFFCHVMVLASLYCLKPSTYKDIDVVFLFRFPGEEERQRLRRGTNRLWGRNESGNKVKPIPSTAFVLVTAYTARPEFCILTVRSLDSVTYTLTMS
jgi:hypothetical protein